jgi:hypothetical protein
VKQIEHTDGEVALKYGGSKRENRALCYAMMAAYVFVLYSIGQRALHEIDHTIVPSGDSMTYVPFLFDILTEAHRDMGWALGLIVTSSYNWLQDFLVLLFSPMLFNERSSLLIVNYVCFLVAMLLIFKTALKSQVPQFWAFCIAMLFAAIPWNFQLQMENNLTEMRVDTLFINSYLCAAILLAWFTAYPNSKAVAVASGIALGAAVWSRWNAVVYVMMVVAGASLAGLMRFAFAKARPSRAVLTNCAILALICLSMAAIYFGCVHHDIFVYGSEIAASISFSVETKLAGAEWLLLNVPGLAICGRWFWPVSNGTPPYAIALTILSHAVVVYSAVSGARRIRSPQPHEVLTAALGLIGATTFYCFMIFAVVTFGGYYARPEIRELHGVVPALAAVLCCALSALSAQLSRRHLAAIGDLNKRSLYILVGLMAAFSSASVMNFSLNSFLDGSMWQLANVTYGPHGALDKQNKYDVCTPGGESTQWYLPSEDLKGFILRFSQAAGGKNAYFFWSGYFNTHIVRFYTAQADLASIRMVPDRSPLDEQVWYATLRPTELTSESWFREFLKYVFSKADYVVIPEQLLAMQSIWSSPMAAYYKDIAAALNSPEIAPDYLVWGIVEENDTRVLVLKKDVRSEKDAELEPFPRTWGTPAQIIGRQFHGALVVSAKRRLAIDVNAQPRLMFTYEGYNVARVGQQGFVGVGQELGDVDIAAILRNDAPCPPIGQFIVAHDIASLEDRLAAASIKYPSDSKIPVLLHAYRSFNIVRVGRQFVGVSMTLGRIDVAAVLANLAPRPPAGDFIVASDLPSLEANIRRECPILSIRYFKALAHQIHEAFAGPPNREKAPGANPSRNAPG